MQLLVLAGEVARVGGQVVDHGVDRHGVLRRLGLDLPDDGLDVVPGHVLLPGAPGRVLPLVAEAGVLLEGAHHLAGGVVGSLPHHVADDQRGERAVVAHLLEQAVEALRLLRGELRELEVQPATSGPGRQGVNTSLHGAHRLQGGLAGQGVGHLRQEHPVALLRQHRDVEPRVQHRGAVTQGDHDPLQAVRIGVLVDDLEPVAHEVTAGLHPHRAHSVPCTPLGACVKPALAPGRGLCARVRVVGRGSTAHQVVVLETGGGHEHRLGDLPVLRRVQRDGQQLVRLRVQEPALQHLVQGDVHEPAAVAQHRLVRVHEAGHVEAVDRVVADPLVDGLAESDGDPVAHVVRLRRRAAHALLAERGPRGFATRVRLEQDSQVVVGEERRAGCVVGRVEAVLDVLQNGARSAEDVTGTQVVTERTLVCTLSGVVQHLPDPVVDQLLLRGAQAEPADDRVDPLQDLHAVLLEHRVAEVDGVPVLRHARNRLRVDDVLGWTAPLPA